MFNKLLKKSWNPFIFRVFSLGIFLIFMMVLYYGTLGIFLNLDSKLVMFFLWTLWWPFLYLTLFFLGRFWCGFLCPVGLINEFGNSLNRSKKDSLLRYPFLSFIIFFLVVFWEQISGLFGSSRITLIFLLTFFLSAFVIGIILPRAGFCRHFCPIGSIFKPFGRLSLFGIRTDRKKCSECKTRECIRGGKYPACPVFLNVPNLQSNSNCLMCTNCIKNCPYESAKLTLLKPGEELKKKIGFNLSESLFIIAILGFSLILTTKGTGFFRFFNFSGTLLRAFDFIFSIGSFFLFFFLITLIYSFFYSKNTFKKNLIEGGYVFLPLAFSLMFILIVFGFLGPLMGGNFELVSILKYVILIFGAGWSMKVARDIFSKPIIYRIAILLIVFLWIFILLPGPLNFKKIDTSEAYYIQNGEVVNMQSFSMGYKPSVLKIKSGGYFDLNITNMDIHHTFELDELNTHLSFLGKETKLVRINVQKPGIYEFYCAIPGHLEAGMKGVLIVE